MYEVNPAFKPFYSAAVLCALGTGATLFSDTREVFESFVQALKRHDIDAALSHVAEDFLLRDEKSSYRGDRESLRIMLGWDVAVEGSTEFRDVLVDGDTVHVRAVETNRFIRLLGIEQGEFRLTFVIRDDLIREEIIGGSTEFMRSVTKALEPALAWATTHQPENLAKVYPDGQLIYTEETGRLWIALLEEWRAQGAGQ